MSATVLLASDDPEVIRAVQGPLAARGYRVIVERDGLSALRAIESHPPADGGGSSPPAPSEGLRRTTGAIHIDAAIVDSLTPAMSGPRLAEAIRALPHGAALPMVLLSVVRRGVAQREALSRRLDLVALLDKPLDSARVVKTIAERLPLTSTAASTSGERPSPLAAVGPRQPLASTGGTPVHPPRGATPAPPVAASEVDSNATTPIVGTDTSAVRRAMGASTRSEPLPPPPAAAPPPARSWGPQADQQQKRERQEVERAATALTEGAGDLRGRLKTTPFPRLLHQLYRQRATGGLFLLNDTLKKIVYVRDGHPVFVKSNVLSECLGKVLVRAKMISDEECEESLRRIKTTRRLQGTTLIEMGVLSPQNLRFGLELQLQLKLFDIFAWGDGEFQFRADAAIPNELIELRKSNAQLLHEGIRRCYTPDRLTRELAPSMALYPAPHRSPELRFQSFPLEPGELQLIARLDGSATLATVLDECDLPTARALALTYAVLVAELVELGPEPRTGLTWALRGDAEGAPLDSVATLTHDLRNSAAASTAAQDGMRTPHDRETLAAELLRLRSLNHFAALDLPEETDDIAVERAYARVARAYHPDHFADRPADVRHLAAEIFARVDEAHRVLCTAETREAYRGRLDPFSPVGTPADSDGAGRTLAAERACRRGELLLAGQRYADAVKELELAIELGGQEVGTYHALLGWCIANAPTPADERPKALSRAMALLHRAIELEPTFDRAYVYLGILFKRQGKPDAAAQQFERALQCNPDGATALAELNLLSLQHTVQDL
jgi:CheY-like chemotaxis protein/tetratricopeptide (TPR) repeat protein